MFQSIDIERGLAALMTGAIACKADPDAGACGQYFEAGGTRLMGRIDASERAYMRFRLADMRRILMLPVVLDA